RTPTRPNDLPSASASTTVIVGKYPMSCGKESSTATIQLRQRRDGARLVRAPQRRVVVGRELPHLEVELGLFDRGVREVALLLEAAALGIEGLHRGGV